MSHLASDDSEYCSDFSCDSLNLSSVERGEDCETVPSAETSVGVNGAIDSFETEVMATDPQLPWYDATETLLTMRTAAGDNIEVGDIPDPSPNGFSDEAWTAGYDQALTQPPNGMEDMSQLFDRLTLASGGVTKTARSDDGYNRPKNCNIRVAKSWSCLHSMSHRTTKIVRTTSKHVSYLELYRRKTCSIGGATQTPVNTEKQDDKQHLLAASTKITEKETQQCGRECPSDTLIINAGDIGKVNDKTDEFCDVVTAEVIQEPCSKCPSEKQFIQAACNFTKSLSEQETLNKKPCTKHTANNIKNLRQAPLKVGSLGFDKEAVQEKYERFKRKQCYGEQASMRNRMKMSLVQKANDTSVEDLKDVNIGKSNIPETYAVPKKSGHLRFAVKSDSRQKNEISNAVRAKNYSQAIRESALASRRSGLKSMPLPSKVLPVPSQDSMDPIKPLVERHLKENEIVDTIKRSFGRTKLNLKS